MVQEVKDYVASALKPISDARALRDQLAEEARRQGAIEYAATQVDDASEREAKEKES